MDSQVCLFSEAGLRGLVDDIAGFQTQFEILRFLKRIGSQAGYAGFLVFRLPATFSNDMTGSPIITNWPAELANGADRSLLGKRSPLLQKLTQTSIPFVYDAATLYGPSNDDVGRDHVEALQRSGLGSGIVFPLTDGSGERGAMVLAGPAIAPDMTATAALALVAAHIFDRIHQLSQKDRRSVESLTDREIDCLTWTSAGKTSAEIAEILGLSEHTVNHYLNRATRKLDTVNRTQAVAKALRAGIIR